MTTVSVILCSYNQGQYLRQAVESVFEQTFADWELIVVDNGSTDGSQALLERYRSDPRVKLILHDRNEAITRRLNHAIHQARGQFISLLYSDDYYMPDKLATQVARFSELPPDYGVVHSPGRRLNVDTGEEWTDLVLPASGGALGQLLDGFGVQGFINPISPLIRRTCFERYPFHEELFVEGEGIFFRFALTFKFCFDNKPTVVMRDHVSNLGRSIVRNTENVLRCLEHLGRHPDFPEAARCSLERAVVRTMRAAGWNGARTMADGRWARAMFGQAIVRDWRQLFSPQVILGLGLLTLPTATRSRINQALFRIRRPRAHVNYVGP